MPTKTVRSFGRPPEYSTAIVDLCPGASWSISGDDYSTLMWNSADIPKPSEDEIKAKLEEQKSDWNSLQYSIKRFNEYPKIEDQLALLWDDMDKGIIPGKETSSWFASIQEVKNNIPKS